MRWKRLFGGLALLLAGVVGCKQTVYVTEDDVNKFKDLKIPNNLGTDPALAFTPATARSLTPATVDKPDREVRFMSLAEAIAIALEQGVVGNQSVAIQNLYGTISATTTAIDQGLSFNGGADSITRVGSSDSIRVLRLDPAIIGAGIESSLSKFDAVFTSSMSWNTTDRPIASAIDEFQAAAGVTTIDQQVATPSVAIIKPLPTGGVAGITFSAPYTNTNLQAAVNPQFVPDLQFAFEQPLLQGFGVDINELRASHPGDQLFLFPNTVLNTQPTAEGILITRVRFDQQRAEFERNVQIMVLNVEVAYWNLYYGYWNLYAQEQGLRFAYEAWRLSKSKFEAGRGTIADVGQTRGQYESFRANRLQALNDTLELERQLRDMLGMPQAEGKRLVPSDQPTLAEFRPDWDSAQDLALASRPELYLARQGVKVAQMNLLLQKNALLPNLTFGGTYDINSLGNRLDGPNSVEAGQDNAFRELASNHFNNWSMQLRLNVPIGFRNAHANVRIAQLQLARAYETLADQERKTISFLQQYYRRIPVTYELIRVQRAARESYADQLRVRMAEYDAGKLVLDQLLEAERFWANSLSQEYLAIRDYNNALVTFEYAKGSVLTRNNIVVAEGALPGFAQKRAVEHLEERSRALKVRERPGSLDNPVMDKTLDGSAPALPTLLDKVPPLQNVPSTLPLPVGNATTAMPAAPQQMPALSAVGKGPAATPATAATTPVSMATSPTLPSDDSQPLPTIGSVSDPSRRTSTFGTDRGSLPPSSTQGFTPEH